MNQKIKIIRNMLAQIQEHRLSVYAAQSAFFLTVAAIPFLMLAMNMVYILFPEAKDQIVSYIISLIPASLSGFLTGIINEVYAKSSGTVITFSAITALWSSSKGLFAVEQGLDQVYGTQKPRGYFSFRLTCLLYTFLFIGVLWGFSIFMLFGHQLASLLAIHFPMLTGLLEQIMSYRITVSLVVLIIFFMALYSLFPGREANFGDQLPGALIAALGWLIFSYGYSFYMNNIYSFSYTYGSMTAIILMMLWLYFCMTILLLGAELNRFRAQNNQL